MFSDILLFLRNITFIDYIFFFTVVFLIILVVSLIYFVKVNEDEIVVDDNLNDPDNLKIIKENIEKEEPKVIQFTSYEKEQEEKAIISYDELLSNTGEFQLNYVDDNKKDNSSDIEVKKVDLNNLVNQSAKTESIPKMEVHVISLAKEEEFLKALKQLQSDLQ